METEISFFETTGFSMWPFIIEQEADTLKKTAIISKQNGNTDKEQLFARGYNLILPQNSSVIDLPNQIGNVLINNDKITFKAISWCMFPVIWAGDIIKIKPIKPINKK